MQTVVPCNYGDRNSEAKCQRIVAPRSASFIQRLLSISSSTVGHGRTEFALDGRPSVRQDGRGRRHWCVVETSRLTCGIAPVVT